MLEEPDSHLAHALSRRPTGVMGPHDVALDIGLAVNHSTYDTLYLAFAVAVGARGLVLADGPFAAAMTRHDDPVLAAMMLPLDAWARSKGLM